MLSCSVRAQVPDEESSFTARLINIEAPVNETFRYQATLQNNSEKSIIYELNAEVPDGWRLAFKARGSQITSINMEPNTSESISIEVIPAYNANPSKYTLPVSAVSGNETLELSLEAVVEGSFDLELTTPSGRLSDDITEGKKAEIDLVVKNTGSLPLKDITLSSQTPPNWSATFSPAEIDQLEPGKTQNIVATLSVPDKTLAGDYVSRFTAKNSDANSTASFRMTVKTSLLSGWIGIMVILIAIGFVYYLIRKFGRR
ncbi:hypothetical protein GCM10028791_41660 [Echinicola sediminis]